ncbi:fatty acid-binding protein, brain-like isoform X2 [Hemibagrus wyckioides]|uniref:fatty acid-binding protein, brain-like isoform X2 n=1 Tax=Hemibagrus wyckioides TaxID=337641 RepID=UPI00266C7618|nr:fatty acid-binding protein, brain-like isoform X2 [Hemibagrus wyckioides]
MDAFFGSWTLVTKENANEYMEALVVIFSQDGDYIVKKIKMFEAINRTFTLTFKLGEEFDESTIDFRVCKSVLNLEGGKLIHLQKWDGKENTTIYEVQDEKLIITLIFRDIVSVWTFVKIK